MEFTGLTGEKDYVLWISGTNELPGEAEIMEEGYIRS